MTPNLAAEVSTTFRHPLYTYFHLSLNADPSASFPPSSSRPVALDEVTALSYLTSALHQSLGLTGAAIPIDILKVEGQDIWIRVPHEDGSAVMAAVSQWSSTAKGVALRILGRSAWLGALVGRKGGDGRVWSLER